MTLPINADNHSYTYSASGYTGAYDDSAHGITATVPVGATVKYGTAPGSCTQTASPAYTNVGNYTVYYQVTKPNYKPETGSTDALSGAQEKPVPRGSVSVADANPVIAYLYSADSGVSWTDAGQIPQSGSGHIVPGIYQIKMTYTGDGYKGTKTTAFTVKKRAFTAEKETLEAEDKNYDGTLTAALKEGGAPALTLGREFYIIRAHEGEHTFMHDLDEEPDTITISTDMFSSYAIAYAAAGSRNGGNVCGLCHICPTFLGVCCFIWLAAVIVVILFTVAVISRREKEEKQKE